MISCSQKNNSGSFKYVVSLAVKERGNQRNAVIGRFQPLALREDVGALWKDYFISERMKQNLYGCHHKELFFWKTYDRQKIDLVEESSEGLAAFELKWSDRSVKEPVAFAKAYPDASFHVVNRDNYLEYI